MFTKKFWKGLGERAIKTFFQSGAAATSVFVVSDITGIHEVNWLSVLSIAALATILSAATSIGNADFTAGEEHIVIEVVDPK